MPLISSLDRMTLHCQHVMMLNKSKHKPAHLSYIIMTTDHVDQHQIVFVSIVRCHIELILCKLWCSRAMGVHCLVECKPCNSATANDLVHTTTNPGPPNTNKMHGLTSLLYVRTYSCVLFLLVYICCSPSPSPAPEVPCSEWTCPFGTLNNTANATYTPANNSACCLVRDYAGSMMASSEFRQVLG